MNPTILSWHRIHCNSRVKKHLPSSLISIEKNPRVSTSAIWFPGRKNLSKTFVPSIQAFSVTAGVKYPKVWNMVLIKADFPDPAMPKRTIFTQQPSISPSIASWNFSNVPILNKSISLQSEEISSSSSAMTYLKTVTV